MLLQELYCSDRELNFRYHAVYFTSKKEIIVEKSYLERKKSGIKENNFLDFSTKSRKNFSRFLSDSHS